MPAFEAPLRDMRFVLWDLHGGDALFDLPALSGFARDEIDMVLEEAGRFCSKVLAPANRAADEEGCRMENGVVRTPSAFPDLYEQYRAGGWPGLSAAPEDGGMGLPHVIQTLFDEMLSGANLAFTSYPGLSLGAYQAIREHASPELRRIFLPPLAEGRWTGTMCLTEPHCGTDLSMVRSRAEPLGNGRFAISGTKIFISAGDHDLAENIVHLVLARLPDAPPGIPGLSLFLVPKYRVAADGEPGARNGVIVTGIEHKMGLKGSATCQLSFESAEGFLVGAANKGMRAMFSMMNVARLAVAAQGIGLAEAASQAALAYARERVQGRDADGPTAIIRHPDVRRMLLVQKSLTEGMRALAVWIGVALDRRAFSGSPAERQAADDFVSLMTPVAKAFCTDTGVDCASLGIQIFGGHGYIRETGVEQIMRDARIGPIYEGTNGVQALDLVGRKIAEDDGRRLATVFGPVAALIDAHKADPDPVIADMTRRLEDAFSLLRHATETIRGASIDDAGAGSTAYLRLFALVSIGYLWLRMALLSQGSDDTFHRAKIATARFFMSHPLSECAALAARIADGGACVVEFEEELFH